VTVVLVVVEQLFRLEAAVIVVEEEGEKARAEEE